MAETDRLPGVTEAVIERGDVVPRLVTVYPAQGAGR
jgi:hypothetical protein